MGFEVWGNEQSIRDFALDFCKGRSAYIHLSWPYREYGVVKCIRRRGSPIFVKYEQSRTYELP